MEKHATTPKSYVTDTLSHFMHSASPRMHTLNIIALVVSLILTTTVLVVLRLTVRTQGEANQINEAYQACQEAVNELQASSDSLTSEARQYVDTGNRLHLINYVSELEVLDRRGKALETLREHASNDAAVTELEQARTLSDELAQTELHALRLMANAQGESSLPDALSEVKLSDEERKLSVEQQEEIAHNLMYGNDYTRMKLSIQDQVQSCSELLVETLREELAQTTDVLNTQLTLMRINVIALLLVAISVIAMTSLMLLWPMSIYERNIRDDEALEPGGAQELRYLTAAYNEMYARNHDRAESLTFEAHFDALTGVHNRGSFDDLLTRNRETCALILVDIDYFKNFNDDWGHEMGDAILVEVAATLFDSFKSTDYVCRIGGDEFAVIMVDAHNELHDVIARRITKVASFLRDDSNGLPAATVSVGIAFGEAGNTSDELFNRADRALYTVKRRGRDGMAFFGDDA